MASAPALRHWPRRLLLVVAGALGVLVLLALVDLLRIRADLASAQHDLHQLDVEQAQVAGGLAGATARAADRLHNAADVASSSVWLRALDVVPLVGDQVEGLRHLTAAADELGAAARSAGAAVDTALVQATGSPAGRVALLDVATEQLSRVTTVVASLDVGPPDRLVWPVSAARHDLQSALDKGRSKLAEGRSSLAALRRLLDGPTRLLVLGANNAEMTAGSGMPLSGGVASVVGGDISLGEFAGTAEAQLGSAGVDPPGDLSRIYAPMGMGHDFRGTTSSPNFPVTASLMAQMAARNVYGAVDGVAVVDAVTLRDLLAIIGPVEVAGTSYDAGNVLVEVLNANYLRFGSRDVRFERKELQGEIAKAVFEALKSRHIPLAKLVSALRGDAEGRHLLLWSADPDLEHVWDQIGASGRIPPDGLLVAPENFDGDKLDWYLRPTLDITVTPAADHSWVVDMAVTVANPRRDQTSSYIEGESPNEHFIWMDLHLPESAGPVTAFDHPLQSVGSDPPSKVAVSLDDVPTGETRVWHFQFSLPASERTITVLPTARVVPMDLTLNGFAFTDTKPITAVLADAYQPPGPASPFLATGTLLAALGACFALSAHRQTRHRRAEGLVGRAILAEPSFDERAAALLLLAGGMVMLGAAL